MCGALSDWKTGLSFVAVMVSSTCHLYSVILPHEFYTILVMATILSPSDWALFQSHSQSYFTAGSLPPISSSWRRAPSDSREEFFFFL
jgi:hypothetical protein